MAYDDGITLHGKHSYRDFGAWLRSKTINIPATTKITETVPYMQGTYDYSELYGEQTFEERELTYQFDMICNSKNAKQELRVRVTKFVNWLKSSIKSKMIDDDYPGYYFLAEAIDNIDIDDTDIYLFTITVQFTAYALMIKNDYEGKEKWDTFCFLTDVMQDTSFEINGRKEVNLINNGIRSLTPVINCDSEFIVRKDNLEYRIKKGSTKDYRFLLNKGDNNLTIIGNGKIEFLYNIEVL